MKPTKKNPKDLLASLKVPLHLWSASASARGAVGLLEGCLKYGRNNFRENPVHASVYVSAVLRHIKDWFEGNDLTPDSGNDHIGLALANLAIICEAQMCGTLIDDRNYKGSRGYQRLMKTLEGTCAQLYLKYGKRNPRHYSRLDEAKSNGDGNSSRKRRKS